MNRSELFVNGHSAKLSLSVKQAIEITGLGRTTLWKAINRGKLKCFRVGRRVLFSPDHLQEFLNLHEQVIQKSDRFKTKRGNR